MKKRILIIQGHPDPAAGHFGHALSGAYTAAARVAGHEVQALNVAELDFRLLHNKDEWDHGLLPPSLLPAQQAIQWAEHLVFFFPLWLGSMPALLKGFLEQVARPGFALSRPEGKGLPKKLLAGRSARVVVTMGMPAPVYRWILGAHGLKALGTILKFVGISPVRETLVGMVEGSAQRRSQWLAKIGKLGAAGE